MRTEDGCIIHKCLNGEPEAFGIVVDKYREGIYSFVYAKLGNFHDAQDVAQEVFLQAYRDLRTLRRWESFAFWLYRIASARCKMWLRARSRRVDSRLVDDQSVSILADASMNSYREGKLDESVREALDSLPDVHREALVLHYFGGMNGNEMARALGISPGAVRKRLSRARIQLKEEIVTMMDTAFEGQRLRMGFTIHVMEIAKRIRIHPTPRTSGLPWGLSLAAGIIIAILSIGSRLNLSELFPPPASPAETYEAEMMKFGEMPVEMLRISRMPFPFGKQGNSYGSGFQLTQQQNAVLMAPRGEGGEFPEEPSARLGNGTLSDIAYSPDGKLIAVASYAGIWLYDANDLTEIELSREHTESPYERSYRSIAFSPDGKTLAAGDSEYDIQLWDINGQTQIGVLKGHTSSIYSIAFSPDGKALASGSYDKTIRLWDIQGQEQTGMLRGHKDAVCSVTFSPDGKTLASGSNDNTILLWDAQRQEQIGALAGHTDSVRSVVFSPDGKTLASGSYDKTIRLWDVQEQEQTVVLSGHTGEVSSITYSSDGKILTSCSYDKTIRLWDIQGQKQAGLLKGHTEKVLSVALSPDGKTLASGSYNEMRLWDFQARKQTAAVEGFTYASYLLAFSPDGKTLASGETVGGIRLWDVQERKQIGLLEDGYSTSLIRPAAAIFSPDGRTIASIHGMEIYLFDVQEQKHVGTLKGHTEEISSIAFTPDGKILASSGNRDKTVRLWDMTKLMDSQKQIGVLWNGSWTHCLSISPDGETLAVSVGDEKLVRLWDIPTQKEIGVLQDTCAAWSVAISPDGKTVASCNQCGQIRLWDMETQKQIGMLESPGSNIQSTFSPDSRWLVSFATSSSGTANGVARVWDIQDQEQIATAGIHPFVYAVAFSPDGRWMATAGMQGSILLWEVNLKVPGWSVEPTGKLPGTWGEVKQTALLQNFPNPFNPETWIPYRLADDADVAVSIRNISGQLIRELNLGHKPAGSYIDKTEAAYWDGTNESGESVASGIYFYTIQTAGDYSATKKMVVAR